MTRNKNKLLVFIIFLLLLTNIVVVSYFLCRPGKTPRHNKRKDDFTEVLQKQVGFDQQQVNDYNELKKVYWVHAKTGMEEILRIKNAIFDLTRNPATPDSVVEKLADSISTLQKNVEINAYKHVVGTRKICRPDQQPAYDSLMKRIINRGRMGRGSK